MDEIELWNKFKEIYRIEAHRTDWCKDAKMSPSMLVYHSVSMESHYVAMKSESPRWDIIGNSQWGSGWEALMQIDVRFAAIKLMYI